MKRIVSGLLIFQLTLMSCVPAFAIKYKGELEANESVTLPEQGAAPANPGPGKHKVYMKADGLYRLDSVGTETRVGEGGATQGYLSGLTLAPGSVDAAKDIDIATGVARDDADNADLRLSSTLTKQSDFAWAEGTNAGGMFIGALAGNTWYHVCLIKKDADGTIDAGFDTTVNCANRPAGWTAYRRLGSIKTNSSSDIQGFLQIGSTFLWNTRFTDISYSSFPTLITNLETLTVPPGVRVGAVISASCAPSVSASLLVYTPGTGDNPLLRCDGAGGNFVESGPHVVWTDTSAQIGAYGNSTGMDADVFTTGWIDPRGTGVGGGGGVGKFTDLTDTPSAITSSQFLRGNSGGTALEYTADVVQESDFGTGSIRYRNLAGVMANISPPDDTLIGRDSTTGDGDVQALTATEARALLGQPVIQQVHAEFSAVATGTTLVTPDDTIPQNTEGDEYMTLTITPTSVSSLCLVEGQIMLASSATQHMTVALFQDASAGALMATDQFLTIDIPGTIPFRYRKACGTTSATTFKVRAGGHQAGTTTFNGYAGTRKYGAVPKSFMTITEISP